MLDTAGGRNQGPQRPGVSLPNTHTHTLSLTLWVRLSLWTHGDYLPCLFFFCSSSSPGTPGIPRKVLCEFLHTTPAAPGLEGSSVGRRQEEVPGGSRGVMFPAPRQGRMSAHSQEECPAPTMDMSIQSQPQESHTGVPSTRLSPTSFTDTGGSWDAPLPSAPLCPGFSSSHPGSVAGTRAASWPLLPN